jgi:hypothetical protein
MLMIKSRAPILRGYVSEIDQFLRELEHLPGVKSDARLKEEQKYQRIFALRDVPQTSLQIEMPWKNF